MGLFMQSQISKLLIITFLVCSAFISAQAKEAAKPILSDSQIKQLGYKEASNLPSELPGYRPLKRVLLNFVGADQIKKLQSLAPAIEFVSVDALAESGAKVTGSFDAIVLSCGSPVSLKYITNVAWVHSFAAGVEDCLSHPSLEPLKGNYILTNSRGAAAATIAEHAIGMTMSFSRGLHVFRDSQGNAAWDRQLISGNKLTTTINGKTMLILGLGAIGKEVAQRAKALGMTVTATRNSSREKPDFVDYVGLSDETLTLAKAADVIVNTLPLTASTKGVLDETFFKAMKNSALLVSVGRGATTNTNDLLAALKAGELRGAALDVTDPEPLPSGHPLWKQKNVIITPHIAGTGGGSSDQTLSLMLENLRRYQADKPLLNMVDKQAGY
jgi:phosphoglycerate dehydrogenase-like enzyme